MTRSHAGRLAGLIASTIWLVASCSFGQAQPSGGASPTPQVNVSLNVLFGSNYFGRNSAPHCPNWPDHFDNVVLAQARLTYTTDEISRIASAANGGRLNYDQVDPKLLDVQPGAATGAAVFPPSNIQAVVGSSACAFELDVTNTGTSAVQIPRVGLRLTNSPVPNSAIYRLVEFCSVLQSPLWCGPQIGAGPPPCAAYGVEVALDDRPPGSDFLNVPAAVDYKTSQPCPPVTLTPQQTVTFVIGAYSMSPVIYHAVPVIEVITPTSSGPAVFSKLAAVYAFADPSQFACYKLSGSTFVLWERGAAAYDVAANATAGAWCP